MTDGILKCENCGHSWTPRRCPACNSKTWQKKRIFFDKIKATLTCKRCGESWVPRSHLHKPKRCARCGSLNWQVEPERKRQPEAKQLKCLRCGYTWYQRYSTPPKVCANRKCSSPYWDKPRGWWKEKLDTETKQIEKTDEQYQREAEEEARRLGFG